MNSDKMPFEEMLWELEMPPEMCDLLMLGVRAVTFDAFGTLLRLDRPYERLQENLKQRGVEVPLKAAEKAFRAEMALYVEHMNEAKDEASLTQLRLACAKEMMRSLEEQGHRAGFSPEEGREVLMESIAFQVYPDVEEAIDWCRRLGTAVGVVANWDCSLQQVLEKTGLWEKIDFAVVSALVGYQKPAPEIFERAMEELGMAAEHGVHLGDDYQADVEGAHAAGLKAILVDREGREAKRNCVRIASLTELPEALVALEEVRGEGGG